MRFVWAMLAFTALSCVFTVSAQAAKPESTELSQAYYSKAARDIAIWTRLLEGKSADRFETYASFVAHHSDWPRLGEIRTNAEKQLALEGGYVGAGTLSSFFNAAAPRTPEGVDAYVSWLSSQGRSAEVKPAVQSFWRQGSMTKDQQYSFAVRWGKMLTAQDHFARASRLVWQENYDAAQAMLPRLQPADAAVIKARLALKAAIGNASKLVAEVPAARMDDAGLVFDRLRWRIRNDDDDGAMDLLIRINPKPDGYASQWWKQRDYLARIALEEGRLDTAYAVAASHGLSPVDGVAYLEGEWTAGWIALRFQKDAAQAATHFTNMVKGSSSVIFKAKSAYWMGRTAQETQQDDVAAQWFRVAMEHSTTFYGQLAVYELYGADSDQVQLALPATNNPEAKLISAFNARSLVAAIRYLNKQGDAVKEEQFFRALTEQVASQDEANMVMHLAVELDRKYYQAMAGKSIGRKGFVVGREAYPTLSFNPGSLDPVLVNAIIRQESQFDVRAQSPAGAKGLMQLMPATAKLQAKKSGLSYKSESELFNPSTNAKLGSAYLAGLLQQFNGVVPFAVAGYNAGPGRIGQWTSRFGSPVGKHIHAAVDWVELIPFSETRSYVMRVTEAMGVYQARLNKGSKAPVSLAQILRGRNTELASTAQ
jgi:soluble lytic murein transglycosylase